MHLHVFLHILYYSEQVLYIMNGAACELKKLFQMLINDSMTQQSILNNSMWIALHSGLILECQNVYNYTFL